MNPLLIIRTEILDIIILTFLLILSRFRVKVKQGKDIFLRVALMALGHVIFGLVTEITVNSSTVSHAANDVCHIFFFLFALLFSVEYFRYAMSLVFPDKKARPYLIMAYVLAIVAIIVMCVSPIDYLSGDGTKYSAGTGPTMCYAMGVVMFFITFIIYIAYRRRIDKVVIFSLIPITIVGLALMVVQIFVPEFLFTSSALTLMTIGLFMSIENPMYFMSDRAYIDSDTRAYNKNCYDDDVKYIQKSIDMQSLSTSITVLIVDLNGLKMVNDTKGHLEGDKLLFHLAKILMDDLEKAYRVYRIGGDEFAAIYKGVVTEDVQKEIVNARNSADNYSKTNETALTFSVGYSELKQGENFIDAVRHADIKMYEDKEEYYKRNGIDRRRA